jgi:bacterioferritin-associated ferredoxin
MIVCLCAGVDDCEIRSCIGEGARSLGDLARKCGAGVDCGGCIDLLEDALDEAEAADAADAVRLRVMSSAA